MRGTVDRPRSTAGEHCWGALLGSTAGERCSVFSPTDTIAGETIATPHLLVGHPPDIVLVYACLCSARAGLQLGASLAKFAVCALLPLHDRPTTVGDPERCVRLPRHLATSAVQRFCVLPQHRPCARHTTQGQLPRSASNGTPPKANYRRVPPMATAAQTPWKSRGQRVASCRRRSAGVAHAAIRGP